MSVPTNPWHNIDFDARSQKLLEMTPKEREEDEKRMMFDPIRDDPQKIFDAGIPMMRSIYNRRRR